MKTAILDIVKKLKKGVLLVLGNSWN